MIIIRIIAALLILLFHPKIGASQVNLSITPPQGQGITPQDLLEVTIDNPTNQQGQIRLQAELTNPNSGAVMATFETAGFPMPMGYSNINPQNLTIARQQFRSQELQSHYQNTGTIKGGNYELTIKVMDVGGNRELANATRVIKIEGTQEAEASKGEQVVNFYGNGYVEGHTSNRQGYLSEVPRQYVRTSLQPSMEIGPAPLSLDIFYTTEQSRTRQEMNTFAFLFDEQRFVDNMRRKLTEVLLKEVGQESKDVTGKMKRLNALERTLNDPNLQDQLKQLDQMDEIEAKLENEDLVSAAEKANNLEQKIQKRSQTLKYDVKKQQIQAKIEVYQEVTYKDSVEEQARRQRVDSLQTELQELEATKDSVLAANKQDRQRLQQLKAKQQQYQQLKAKYDRLKEIEKLRSQVELLRKEYENLKEVKEQMSKSGQLEQYQGLLSGEIPDKQILKEKLQDKGLLSKTESFLFGIDQFRLGTVFPYYSPLILNGVRVQGGEIALNPGVFYLNVTGGISHPPVGYQDSMGGQYEQQFIAGQVGIGQPHRSHFFLTGLRAVDLGGSMSPPDSIYGPPQSNNIFGAELQLTFWERKIRIKGEVAGSKLDSDNELEQVNTGLSTIQNNVPGFLQPTLGSSYGYAYDVEAELRLFRDQTRITAGTKTVDPAYQSFGAPFLRNDLERYEVRAEQFLFDRQIQFSGDYRLDRDNLIWDQANGIRAEHISGRLALRFNKWPYLRLQYIRQDQERTERSFLSNSYFASAGYGYSLGNLQLSTNLNYNRQEGTATDSLGNFAIQQYMINQSVAFPWPLSLNANVAYTDHTSASQDYDMITADVGASVTLFKKIGTSVGVRYTNKFDQSDRIGYYGEINYPFLDYFSFNLRFDNRYYENVLYPDRSFEEYILRARLSVNW